MLICDFHREQAWDRWLRKKANGCANERLKILALLRSIAHAETTTDEAQAINNLQNSSYWTDYPNLKDYITKYWLGIKQVSFILILSKDLFYC